MNLTNAYDLFHRGTLALAKVENSGIRIDTDYLDRQMAKTERRITKIKAELRADPLFTKWRKRFGERTNLGSGEQLAHVIFEIEGFKSKGETATGKYKTDEAAFVDVDRPFVKKYFQMKKLEKTKGTYLQGIRREVVDGYLHPNFDLHTAVSYRSSSSNPNFQNIPVRDPKMGKLIRRAFKARPGHVLVEVDFGGIEVRIAYCYHKDPVMYKYLTDPTTDMHRDMAAQCYKLKPEEVTKQIRACGKGFVFAEFYGSYFQQCAPALWDAVDRQKLTLADGRLLRDVLTERGLTELGACDPKERPESGTFEHHIKEVEEDFWGRRFKVYTAWKEKWYTAYRENGGFQMKTGFEVHGLFNRNDVLNYGIQGSAFHCLLWSLIELQRELELRQMGALIVGQIHDSIIADVPVAELQAYLNLAYKITTKRLPKAWPWICVPLEVECEVCPEDGTWYDKEKWTKKNGLWQPSKA